MNKANSVSNDWMGEGKATYTISREGIPAALLTFDSFKLTVDGKEYTGDEATKAISVAAGNGHTTWGQKDIVATVVYKDFDGNEYTGTQTIVRHITGLPYAANPPKDSGDNAWSKSSWNVKLESSYVQLGAVTGTGEPSIKSPTFNMPAAVDITIKSDVKAEKYTIIKEIKTIYKVYVNGIEVSSKQGSFSRTTLSANTSFSSGSNSLKCESSYKLAGPSVTLYSVSILYR